MYQGFIVYASIGIFFWMYVLIENCIRMADANEYADTQFCYVDPIRSLVLLVAYIVCWPAIMYHVIMQDE